MTALYRSLADWSGGRRRRRLGLAMAFDLADFWLTMIAPVKKFVNHPRTVASMRVTGREYNKFVFAAIPKCEVNSLLALLVFAFFAVTNFFHGNVELMFSFLLVLRLSLHAGYYAEDENDEYVPRCPTFCLCVSV